MAKSASKKVSAKLAKSATKHTSVVAAKRTQIEGKPSLHVFRLKNADAEKAAAVLRQVLDSGSGGKLAADSKSNSIIVNADEATTAQIANVIKNLEEIDRSESRTPSVPKEPQTVSVYPIKYAEVGNLLQLMHTLYGNPTFAIVKVAADTRTNTLIVTAPENRSQEVRSLIVRLDIPTPTDPDKQKVYRTIKLRFADAKQIVLRVAAMLKNEAPEYMAPDPLSNDIIVRTTEDKCNEVAALVNFLDHPKQ
jgi:general secretion pathway protein D